MSQASFMSISEQKVCPFYGSNDTRCDVGCGYITPSDVVKIISNCCGNFLNCGKYAELEYRSLNNRIFDKTRGG